MSSPGVAVWRGSGGENMSGGRKRATVSFHARTRKLSLAGKPARMGHCRFLPGFPKTMEVEEAEEEEAEEEEVGR